MYEYFFRYDYLSFCGRLGEKGIILAFGKDLTFYCI